MKEIWRNFSKSQDLGESLEFFLVPELWRKLAEFQVQEYEEIWRNYEENMKKIWPRNMKEYEQNMKEYEGIMKDI